MQTRNNNENLIAYTIPEWNEEKKAIVLKNNGHVSEVDANECATIHIDSTVLKKDIRDMLGIDRRLLTFKSDANQRYEYLKADTDLTIEYTDMENKFLVTFPCGKLGKVNNVANNWHTLSLLLNKMPVNLVKQQQASIKPVWIRKNIKRAPIKGIDRYYEEITVKPNSEDIGNILDHVKNTDALHLTLCIDVGDERIEDIKLSTEYMADIYAFFREVEHNENIKSLVSFSCFTLDQIKLLLTPNILKKLIYTLSVENILPFFKSMDIIKNEDIFNYILTIPGFINVLAEAKPAQQILSASCAAHSIMKFIYKKENSDRFSMLTEMKIYKEIWTEFGKVADPKKIIEFLQAFDIDVTLIEDKELVEKVISDYPLVSQTYEYTKSFFDKDHYKTSGINEETFPKNSAMLIIVQAGTHMMIAERLSNGDTVLQDAAFSNEKTFHAIEELNKSRVDNITFPSMRSFSGLAFNLFYKNKQNSVKEKCEEVSEISYSKYQ